MKRPQYNFVQSLQSVLVFLVVLTGFRVHEHGWRGLEDLKFIGIGLVIGLGMAWFFAVGWPKLRELSDRWE